MINMFTMGIAALYALTGVAVVLLTYKAVEHRPFLGGIVAITATTGVVLLSRYVGRHYLSLTVQQVESAVIAAAIGAGTGIVLTVLAFQPEHHHTNTENEVISS
ncbi:hypothetical protein OB919_15975 [Halobacteria archaeon AArc-curdl1]|uniref:Uncharacterized protein n=1 Tax=Natronosalvus hydrolyticus TaxID=2979988 RepID=A0AAP3E741_9EURY|nr:hypothetical protein [Halobacteria archaeon AArc-curdl1]